MNCTFDMRTQTFMREYIYKNFEYEYSRKSYYENAIVHIRHVENETFHVVVEYEHNDRIHANTKCVDSYIVKYIEYNKISSYTRLSIIHV